MVVAVAVAGGGGGGGGAHVTSAPLLRGRGSVLLI